jgi:hypothetical protein
MPLYASPTAASDQAALAASATPRFTTIMRESAQGSSTLTAGTAYFGGFTPSVTATVNTLFVQSRGTAATTTTLARMGLFTADSAGSLTLVARSASNTSLCSATFTAYPEALATTGGYPASYTLLAGSRYAIGIVFVGSTVSPQVYSSASLGTTNAWLPTLAMSITAQTDLLTSYAIGSLVGSGTASLLAVY